MPLAAAAAAAAAAPLPSGSGEGLPDEEQAVWGAVVSFERAGRQQGAAGAEGALRAAGWTGPGRVKCSSLPSSCWLSLEEFTAGLTRASPLPGSPPSPPTSS